MTTIFVPQRFREKIAAMDEIASVEKETTIGICRTIATLGYRAELKPGNKPAEVFQAENCYGSFTTVDGSAALFVVPYTLAENLAVLSDVNIIIDTESKFHQPDERAAIEQMRYFITAITLITGFKVTLHITNEFTFEPYDEPGHVHIVLNSRLPGDVSTQRISTLGPINLVQGSSHVVRCAGPTTGRGQIVMFDEEFCIGQTMGTTLYLFIPANTDARPLYAHEHDNPFRIALAKIWEQYETTSVVTPEIKPTTKESFTQQQNKFAELLKRGNESEAKKITEMIEDLGTNLADLYTRLRIVTAMPNTLGDRFTQIEIDTAWDKLSQCPFIASITEDENGTPHFHSIPLVLEGDSGAWYDVGSFTARMKGSELHLWSTRITHPERIAHPHIGSGNTICYGNVTSEMARLTGEYRYADAILLCFRWLFEGYEPTLTSHKLEEWPQATTPHQTGEKPCLTLPTKETSLIQRIRKRWS